MVGPLNNEHGIARVVHHKDYYIRGGDVTFLVENHLFRVHSHFFDRESMFFRQMFIGAAPGEHRSSTPDGDAYTLDEVRSEDFARFLWVFYNPVFSLYHAPLEHWLSILHLANRWSFLNVKDLTVRELEKLDIEPVEKIAIYHNYSIDKIYLIESYVSVCKREKPLALTEGTKLGLETVLRLAEARERMRQKAVDSGLKSPTFEDVEDAEVELLVREIFGITSRPTSPTTSPKAAHARHPSIPHNFTAIHAINGNGNTNGHANGHGKSIALNTPPAGRNNNSPAQMTPVPPEKFTKPIVINVQNVANGDCMGESSPATPANGFKDRLKAAAGGNRSPSPGPGSGAGAGANGNGNAGKARGI